MIYNPENDTIDYYNNGDYVCLEVIIGTTDCIVAPMDVISATFYNFMMEKQGQKLYGYRKLVALRDDSSGALASYLTECGIFLTVNT